MSASVLNLPMPRFRFEVDPSKPLTAEDVEATHYRGRLLDLQTGGVVENAVRLGPASTDKAQEAIAYRLLRTWAEEKALNILHGEHSPGMNAELCFRCFVHVDAGHANDPDSDCAICQTLAAAPAP